MRDTIKRLLAEAQEAAERQEWVSVYSILDEILNLLDAKDD